MATGGRTLPGILVQTLTSNCAPSAISQKTGGAFYTLADIDTFFGTIDTSLIFHSVKSEIVLWNKFWLLVIFVLALGTEWLLRKKYQLI